MNEFQITFFVVLGLVVVLIIGIAWGRAWKNGFRK